MILSAHTPIPCVLQCRADAVEFVHNTALQASANATLVTCDGCGVEHPWENWEAHRSQCTSESVVCPYEGCNFTCETQQLEIYDYHVVICPFGAQYVKPPCSRSPHPES